MLGIWFSETRPRIKGGQPVPTEFDIKKSKRKDFKNQRKDYMKNMHRAHPDVDWEKMDEESRKIRTNKIQNLRQSLITSGNWNAQNKRPEKISRELSGYWQERGSNNLAGRILTADIDWNNNLIYCASDGGNIWRGSLTGGDWTSLTDYLQIKGIHFLRLIEFDNTRRLLIANGDNFYYTDDEGVTLQLSNGVDFLSGWGGNYLKRVIITEDKTIYLLATEGTDNWNAVGTIYKSTDHGRNFTKILTLDTNAGMSSNQSSDHYDIWTSRYFDGFIYLLHNDEFYHINTSDQLEFVSNIPVSGSSENILTGGVGSNYPFFYAHVGGRIYQSMNGGESWIDRGERPQWYFNLQNSFNSSNINRDFIFWGGMEVFKSTSGGSSWTLVNNWWDYYGNEATMLHADIPEVRFFLDPEFNEVALISTDGGLYYSDDALETVQNVSMNGLGVSQYYSTYTKRTFPYNVYAGSQDQGFQRSISPGGDVFDFVQSISGDYGHLSSGDEGASIWCNYPGITTYFPDPLTSGHISLNFPGSGHLWLAPIIEDPYYPNQAYLAGGGLSGGNHLFHLTIDNSAISYEEEPYSFNSTISAMGFSPSEPNHRYVLTYYGSFYHSSDDGGGWQMSTAFDGPDAHYFYGSTIWASQSTSGTVIIAGSGYSNPPVYISYNHGESFVPFNEGLPSTLVLELAGTPDDEYFFAATEIGPYVYISEEGAWTDLSGISAPDQTYWSVEYIPELNTARFGTYGRGIWDFIIDDSVNITGDINFDETVNIQDVILLVNFVLGIDDPDDSQFSAGDINEDDILNIQDIIATINIILDR
ncbi:hypothetical protein EB821_05045 [Candidatus Marinimicrobia bacterium PRS2]|nr:hypothetical protein EB821_05045 [Candidatus Marinimicrobia bacterium PRS2]